MTAYEVILHDEHGYRPAGLLRQPQDAALALRAARDALRLEKGVGLRGGQGEGGGGMAEHRT